jgi:hypothetical protein
MTKKSLEQLYNAIYGHTITKIIIGCILLTILLTCAMTFIIDSALQKEYQRIYDNALDSYTMCNKEFVEKHRGGLNGINFEDDFYCVWTRDRAMEEIAGTREHEIAHELINRDYEHFCNVNESIYYNESG